MRRLLVILILAIAPALFAQVDKTGGTAAHGAEKETHEQAHPTEGPAEGAEHHEVTYFGIPGWILKLLNMIVFIGGLAWLVGGPVKKAFAERSAAIRRAADEAKERRVKADQMAGDIQARLTQIEQEVRASHERAAAEAEAQKILTAAKTEVDNRLKHARNELTAYAGELAAGRAEQILKEKITEQDQKKLFQESLREVGEVRA